MQRADGGTARERTLSRRSFIGKGSTVALGAALAGQVGWLTACGNDDDSSGGAGPTSDDMWALLAADLSGTLLRPGDSAYPDTALPTNLAYVDQRPQGIVIAAGAPDIQTTVRWARDNGLPTVARSGGHSYAGYSTSPGVVIDLSDMASIQLDPDTGTATLGAGALLGPVDDATTSQGFVVPAGRCRTVGIAGLLLGGGIGFNSRPFGLTGDNLIETQVVTADGELLQVTATENPDLFWACQGAGGGNFGINTGFVVTAHPVTTASAYSLTWSDPSAFVPAWAALQDLTTSAPNEFSLHLAAIVRRQASSSSPAGTIVEVIGQHLGTSDELRDLLSPAFAAAEPDAAQIEEGSIADATAFLAEADTPDAFLTKSALLARGMPEDGLEEMFAWIDRFPESGRVGEFKILATGGAIDAVPGDGTAYVHREAAYVNEGCASWDVDASQAVIDEGKAWIEDMYAALAQWFNGSAYQNFIDPTLADWERAYYGSNLDRLVEVKRTYDPDNYFNFAQSIPTSL